MSIVQVGKEDNRQLQNIANILASSKRVIVITGAGISTRCGIPNGLYNLIQAQNDQASLRSSSAPPNHRLLRSSSSFSSPQLDLSLSPQKLKGKDMFSSDVWKDPISTSTFYSFIANLRKKILNEVKQTAATHNFIRTLRDCRRLVRCYTQNIDGLETRVGLCANLDRGKGNRARFARKSLELPQSKANSLPGGIFDGGCEVVQLHGDLDLMRCDLCGATCKFDGHGESLLFNGRAPECQVCHAQDRGRRNRGKRGTKIGSLRPNIVLYGEEHPSADSIGKITTHDLALCPDVLLILGTSLHVHGLKVLVKEFAKAVHATAGGRGKVVYVNLTKPPESVWRGVIDYWVSMDCDEWVDSVRRHRPDLWQIQAELDFKVKKPEVQIPKSFLPYPNGPVRCNDGKAKKTSNTTVSSKLKQERPRKVLPAQKTNARVHVGKENVNKPAAHISPAPERPRAIPVSRWPLKEVLNAPSKHSAVDYSKTTPPLDTSESMKCQLPTPPASGHLKRSQSTTRKRSRSRDSDPPSTPSKRTRRQPMQIWEG